MNYYFCHHQKTGGQSLIKEVKASEKYNVYNHSSFLENFKKVKQPFFISNHFPYNQIDLIQFSFRPISVLREPYSRLVSFWNHVCYKEDKTWWSPRSYHNDICNETDIEIIINNAKFANTHFNSMTRRLGQTFDFFNFTKKENYVKIIKEEFSNPCPPTDKDFENAKYILKSCIVGVTEEYDKSRSYICSLLNIDPIGFHIREPKADNNPLIGYKNKINELNYYDYELWMYATELFKKQTC